MLLEQIVEGLVAVVESVGAQAEKQSAKGNNKPFDKRFHGCSFNACLCRRRPSVAVFWIVRALVAKQRANLADHRAEPAGAARPVLEGLDERHLSLRDGGTLPHPGR